LKSAANPRTELYLPPTLSRHICSGSDLKKGGLPTAVRPPDCGYRPSKLDVGGETADSAHANVPQDIAKELIARRWIRPDSVNLIYEVLDVGCCGHPSRFSFSKIIRLARRNRIEAKLLHYNPDRRAGDNHWANR
jgi:hypothetical protein